MDIKIYQINLDRDDDGVAFESLDMLAKYQHTDEVKAELYDKVFEGEAEAGDLEDVYRIFNIDQPDGYTGRSLSVSDVVEVLKSGNIKPGFYYCDSIGFKEVSFDSEKAAAVENTTITVVMCEPWKTAKIKQVGNTVKGMQTAVKGSIEIFYPFEESVCIVCNDEGKINGMMPSRAIYDNDGEMIDIVYGPFFICDFSGENFGSLSKEQLERYTELFEKPERFVKVDGQIKAIPYDPSHGDFTL